MIAVLPKEGVTREETMREVETIMRIRHGLTLDKPNDFDLVTSDAILAVWDQISAAILLALVVISSIALMVGGIGVMAIMTISVTERTREIGVRQAIGARRREILVQFLIEAAVLTSVGGILGVLMGSAIGLIVNLDLRLPGVAAVVVVRARPRILGRNRHLLRHAAGLARLPPRPDRSSALRIGSDQNPRADPDSQSEIRDRLSRVYAPPFGCL